MSPNPETQPAIHTIFFDIGGVLLTNGWDKGQRSSVLQTFGVSLPDYEARHDAANFRWERGLETARWFFDQTVFYEPRSFTFDDLWSAVQAQSHVLSPELYGLLVALRLARTPGGRRRYKVATLNNESRELNDYRIQAFDLRSFFDFFIASGYVGEMKPQPAIYNTALEISATPAAQAVFIDDKEENCAAARALGMQAIHFQSPAQLNSALAAIGIIL